MPEPPAGPDVFTTSTRDDRSSRPDGTVGDVAAAESRRAIEVGTARDPERSVTALDPEQAAEPRAVLARKRGLPGAYITGGEDPEPSIGRSEERRYGTILLVMVVAIVLAGFVLGIVGVLLGAGTP